MTNKDMKALIRRFQDKIARGGDLGRVLKFVGSDYVDHNTHRGEWIRMMPAGAVVRLKGINIDRIEDNQIVEHWGEADTVGMLIQMGVDPLASRKLHPDCK
jgi:predicted ester cyclase